MVVTISSSAIGSTALPVLDAKAGWSPMFAAGKVQRSPRYPHPREGIMKVASLSRSIPILLAFLTPSSSFALASYKVAGNLSQPLHVCSPPDDDRLFIVEQRGKIKILQNGSVLATPFLDITSKVSPDPYGGLLGLAFHPDYASNGYFYVNYTNSSGNTRVARYRVSSNPNVANPQSETFLLSVSQPSEIHNGGNLAFGPGDGYLYIGMGDGGPGNDPDGRGQDPGSLLGKILRIDVDGGAPYAIPPDNPFVGVAGYRPEIWALGVRQPWGLSFDRLTHDLWIADVGQKAWEEVNFQAASSPGGENYGWSEMEGPDCFDPPDGCDEDNFVLPIH
jgi:glucose/arabinose dehydrogenase